MKLSWLKLLEWVQTSYWVVPSTMALVAAGASVVAVSLDRGRALGDLRKHFWLYGGSVDGARELLSTLAASMITVTGVVFSVTIVVLSLASQQFGPRLLRAFITDLGNQAALGTFIGNFVFDLLVLSQVSEFTDGENFVPRISVTVGLAFSILSAGVLIYFIHHMASSVQAETILNRVFKELDDSIERLYPEELARDLAEIRDEDERGSGLPPRFDEEAVAVRATATGYIQSVDSEALLKATARADTVVRLEHRPGHFIVKGSLLASVWPPSRSDVDRLQQIAGAFSVGSMRTPTQDAEFCIHQLVQVACRALSPGINDPFTAIVCVDRLSAALCKLAGRRFPSGARYDETGRLRIVARPTSFGDLLDAAFDQIRQSAATNVAVSIRLLEGLGRIQEHARRQEDTGRIMRQAHQIEARIGSAEVSSEDLTDVDRRAKDLERP